MILDKFNLKGSVALVTGASRGLGQGMALALAEAGADVALVARTGSALEETASLIKKTGAKALVVPADLSISSEAQRVIKDTIGHYGQIDILLNAAGTQVRKPIFEMTEEDYDYLMSVNLKSIYFLSQAAAKAMAERKKGKIINIASLSSFIGLSNISIYGTSKGGVVSMTRQFCDRIGKEQHPGECHCAGIFHHGADGGPLQGSRKGQVGPWQDPSRQDRRCGGFEGCGRFSGLSGIRLHYGSRHQCRRGLAGCLIK